MGGTDAGRLLPPAEPRAECWRSSLYRFKRESRSGRNHSSWSGDPLRTDIQQC